MALGNGIALPLVKNIVYWPRRVSDHSPLVQTVYTGGKCAPRLWKISPFWLELMGEPVEVISKLKEFVALNTGTAPVGVVWDTLKAFLRD